MSDLTVVIPVKDEAENILRTLSELERHTPRPARVLVIHDSPQDTTLAVLQNYQSPKLQVEPMLNGFGRGALNAIKFGLAQVQSGAALVMMGDLSDDLSILPAMLEAVLAGAGVACGSRYMRGGQHIGGPLFKKTLSRLAGVSLRLLVRFPTHDVTNSYKLYSQEVLRAVRIESVGGFEIGMEITVKAWMAGFQVVEFPSVWRDRPAGVSRFRLWAWLPHYLKWYFQALRHGFTRRQA